MRLLATARINQAAGEGAPIGHATREQLERYVLGVLASGEQRALEAHVGDCLLCGRSLAAEARREMALAAAMSALPRRPTATTGARLPGGRPGLLAAAPSLLALAAALVLVAGLSRQQVERSPRSASARVPVMTPVGGAGASQGEPLLACLLDGEEALCPSAPAGPDGGPLTRAAAGGGLTRTSFPIRGALCRASDGTCRLQSGRF